MSLYSFCGGEAGSTMAASSGGVADAQRQRSGSARWSGQEEARLQESTWSQQFHQKKFAELRKGGVTTERLKPRTIHAPISAHQSSVRALAWTGAH